MPHGAKTQQTLSRPHPHHRPSGAFRHVAGTEHPVLHPAGHRSGRAEKRAGKRRLRQRFPGRGHPRGPERPPRRLRRRDRLRPRHPHRRAEEREKVAQEPDHPLHGVRCHLPCGRPCRAGGHHRLVGLLVRLGRVPYSADPDPRRRRGAGHGAADAQCQQAGTQTG